MATQNISYEELIHQQNYWPLQIVQDEYASALDIPLRIYRQSEAKNIWTRQRSKGAFARRFPTLEKFHDYVTEIVASEPSNSINQLKEDEAIWKPFFTREIEKLCWLTGQSGGYFLIHKFQENIYWRWWEFFFYYNQFVIESTSTSQGTATYCGKYLHIAFTPLSLTQKLKQDCVLVAGPVWEPIDPITRESFELERVEPLITNFLTAIKEEKTHSEKVFMIRMGNNRFPMSSKDLLKGVKFAKRGLTQILKMSLPSLPVSLSELHRCDHIKLVEWSLFALQINKILPLDSSTSNLFEKLTDKQAVYARFDHPQSMPKPPPWIKTQWHACSENDNLSLIPEFEIQDKQPNGRGEMIESLHIILPKELDDSCQESFEEAFNTFLNQLFTRRNARRTESLSVLREELNNRFGIGFGETEAKTETRNQIYDWLCHWIADRIIADQVTLYRYNHGDRRLQTLGFYSSSDKQENHDKQAISDDMAEAAEKDETRKKSICYRCIDERSVRFTRMFDPDTEKAYPENEPLLLPPKGIESNRSAIAAPILVDGRGLGVLEVDGLFPYQFRWENRKFVEEVANIFSPFFYQQHLLKSLHKLEQIVDESSKDKYKEISHQVAVIFLSHSATLWLPSKQNGQYDCFGWYNLPDFEEKEKKLYQESNSIIICNTIVDKETWYPNNVGEGRFNQDWKEAQPSRLFDDLNIGHICVMPIYTPAKKAIGSFILYNQTKEGFDERWFPKITFVSQYVALLLETMHIKKRHIDSVAHGIKTHARLIEKAATGFTEELNDLFQPQMPLKIQLLNHDLKTGIKDILTEIDHFSYKGDNIIVKDENPIISKLEYIISHEAKELLNFCEQFNSIIRPAQKRFDIDDKGFQKYQELCLQMHGYNLRQILANLLDNAVKYADPNTDIKAELVYTDYVFQFILSNQAPCLKKRERFSLFDENFRGYDAAKNFNQQGEGKGLFIVKKICDLYNIGIYYDSENKKSGCWHTFTLSFPLKLVKTGGKSNDIA